MAVRGLILAAALMCSLVVVCYGEVKLSELPKTLTVTTTPSGEANLKAGESKITVTWSLNGTSAADTTKYAKIALKLCFLKVSQIDRPWRKTEDELFKDKTCSHAVATKAYSATGTADYIVMKDVPTAHYFVRAYAVDAAGVKVAYGQTQGVDLFVTAITGRHASIDVAAGVFSAFSVLSLAFFFYLEKKKASRAT